MATFNYPSTNNVLRTDTFDTWKNKTNELNSHTLYVASLLGNFANLNTSNKTVVGAFNEIHSETDTNTANIGDVASLSSAFTTASNLSTAMNNLYTTSTTYTNTQVASEAADRTSADNTLQSAIDTIEVSTGLTGSGGYIQQSSLRYISSASTLADADKKLDESLDATQQELDTTQTSIGTEADGSLSLTGNYISGSVKTSLVALDNQSFTNTNSIASLGSQSSGIQTELDNTQIGAGLSNNGAYNGTISGATSLSSADTILQDQITSNDSDIAAQDTRLSNLETTIQDIGVTSGNRIDLDGNYINNLDISSALEKLDQEVKENETNIALLNDKAGVNFDPSTLASVATSGSYSDLSGTPTNLNQFTNGPKYITDYTVSSADVRAHEGDLQLSSSQITDIDFNSFLTSSNLTGNNSDISNLKSAISGDNFDSLQGTPTHPTLVSLGATTLKGADYQLQEQIKTNVNDITNLAKSMTTALNRSSANMNNISGLTNRIVDLETSTANIDDSTWSGFKIQVLANQATYDNLPSKDPSTVYFIKE